MRDSIRRLAELPRHMRIERNDTPPDQAGDKLQLVECVDWADIIALFPSLKNLNISIR